MNARSINISYGPVTEFPYCGDERTGLKHIMITDNYFFFLLNNYVLQGGLSGGYDVPVI